MRHSDIDESFAEVAAGRHADADKHGDYGTSAAGSMPSTINELRVGKLPSTKVKRVLSCVPVAEIDGADDDTNGNSMPSPHQGPRGRNALAWGIAGRLSSKRFLENACMIQ